MSSSSPEVVSLTSSSGDLQDYDVFDDLIDDEPLPLPVELTHNSFSDFNMTKRLERGIPEDSAITNSGPQHRHRVSIGVEGIEASFHENDVLRNLLSFGQEFMESSSSAELLQPNDVVPAFCLSLFCDHRPHHEFSNRSLALELPADDFLAGASSSHHMDNTFVTHLDFKAFNDTNNHAALLLPADWA